MDQLKLTDEEWKCYADHFSSCDLEGNGKIPLGRASELFQTANLTPDQLSHVILVSGAKRVGQFGRSQFYIALRCIALIQSGIAAERVSVDNLRWQQFDKDSQLPKLERKASPKFDKPPATPTRTNTISHSQPPAPPPKFAIRRSTVTESAQAPSVAPKPHASVVHTQSVTMPPTSYTANNQVTSNSNEQQTRQATKEWASFEELDEPRPKNATSVSNPSAAFAFGEPSTFQNAQTGSTHVATTAGINSYVASTATAANEFDEEHPDENDPIVQRDESEILLDTPPKIDHTDRKFNDEWFHFSENEQANATNANLSHLDVTGHGSKTGSLDKERMYQAAAFQKRKEKAATVTGDVTKAKTSSVSKSDTETSSDDSDDDSTETDGDNNLDDTDSSDAVYRMTQDQRNYYVEHFLSLVPDADAKAHLDGTSARAFFLKSNLPVDDLKRIWQLADADLDGALTLEEFCTAMHLTVLRRNGLEIPSRLELSGRPYAQLDAQAIDQPGDRQPDDAYAHAAAHFDSVDATTVVNEGVRIENQTTFVPQWPSHPDSSDADTYRNPLQQQSSVGAYSTLTDGEDDSQSGYTTNTEGVQVPRPVKFSDAAPPLHRVNAQPFAVRSVPVNAADARAKPPTSKPLNAPFKPPPLPPRKPPLATTALPPSGRPSASTSGESNPQNATASIRMHQDVLDESMGPLSPPEANEWLREQIDKLQEAKMVQERLNRELNAELQETMEQRIALEIQLEHIRRASLI